MRKLSRAFLCSFLAAIFILGCFAFPLRANSMETIKLDEHLHAEYVCNGFTAYRLSISRTTVYLFQPTATSIEYDLKNIDSKVLDQLGDNPFCCIYKDDGTEIPTTYNIWWKSGVAGTDSQYYLEKGEYILIVRSDKVCNLKIDGFDGEIYMTKDGTRMDFTPFPNQGGFIQNYIDDIENHEYKLVVKPGNSGNKYKIYTTNYKNSYRDLDETVEIQINYGEDLFIPIEFNEEKESFNFFFKFQTIGSKEYPFDKCRNILVEKWSIQIIDFSFDDSSSINIQNNLTPKEYFGKGLSYVDMVISEPIAFFTKLPGAQFAAEYFFIKDNDLGANYQITQGKNYEIKPHWYNDQEVYSFTPEKDDTYKLTSSGWDANPYVAVFDSDDNCIGWDDGNYSITDLNFNDYYQHLIKGEVSHNLDMDLDLKAGQTYYFYFTNSLANYYCDEGHLLSLKKNPYSFKLSLKSEYVPDSTPVTPPEAPPKAPSEVSSETPSAPSNSSSGLSFGDFVERLYVVALNRQSEPEGKEFWCTHVENGDLNGAQCANEFLLSKEFNDRKLSDEDFLKVLYKTFFDRDATADPDGFNFWMNSLKTEGRDKVVDGFINSTEWCNICASYGVKSGATRAKATIASKNATDFAERLYTKCLGRDSEEEGLKFWSFGLTNLELTGSQAAHEFFYSKEFQDHNFDNKEYLTRMYRTFMGRDPDEDGMNYWLNNMSNGMTKDQVFNFFVESKEFTEICQSYAIEK